MTSAEFKKWRLKNKLSQERAALELGLAVSTIVRFEAGVPVIFSFEVLITPKVKMSTVSGLK